MALQLNVITSSVLEWSINPISSPNPVYSHSMDVTIFKPHGQQNIFVYKIRIKDLNFKYNLSFFDKMNREEQKMVLKEVSLRDKWALFHYGVAVFRLRMK
jgi:hypothetical protein